MNYPLFLKTRLVMVLLLLYLFANTSFCQADGQRLQRIQKAYATLDGLFKQFAQKNNLPGFVYGLMVDGKLVHTSTYGVINIETQAPVTTQSAFRIASMTKSFTAMAILKLRDEGKLKLDDPVQVYIPEMLGQRMLSKDAESVTIRHLLTHAAGFPEYNPWGDRQLDITDQEMIDMIRKGISFSNVPGVAYEYSNMGFAMLGYIIKKASGMPYQQYINQVVLTPLQMRNTYWDYRQVDSSTLALGYRRVNGEWIGQPLLGDGAYGAMGGMITTMDDFAKYVSFHQSVWPPKNYNEIGPVQRSSVREMHHPWNAPVLNAAYRYPSGRPCAMVSSYGYGLRWAKDCDGRVSIGHSGGLPGFGSNWAIYPDYGIGIISFANLTYAPTSAFNTMMIDTLVATAGLKPLPRKVSPILEQRKNELVKLLPAWNNAEASGIFAENFFMDYYADSLRKQTTALFAKAGKIIGVGKMEALNELRGSFVLDGEKADLEVFFTLTPENPPLIQEYNIRLVDKI